MLAPLVAAGQGDLDACAVLLLPDGLVTFKDGGLVLLQVELDLEAVGRLVGSGPAVNDHGLPGGQLSIHAGSTNTNALLSSPRSFSNAAPKHGNGKNANNPVLGLRNTRRKNMEWVIKIYQHIKIITLKCS